jgi:hypothetical protein
LNSVHILTKTNKAIFTPEKSTPETSAHLQWTYQQVHLSFAYDARNPTRIFSFGIHSVDSA